jgi:hypothetical protein
VWAILFLLNTAGEGFGLQPCPYHDGFGEHESSSSTGGHDHSHHGHAPDGDEKGDTGTHPDADLCTHVEACQFATGSLLPVGPQLSAFAFLAVPAPSDRVPPAPPIVRHPPFFLPFSNAPPALG